MSAPPNPSAPRRRVAVPDSRVPARSRGDWPACKPTPPSRRPSSSGPAGACAGRFSRGSPGSMTIRVSARCTRPARKTYPAGRWRGPVFACGACPKPARGIIFPRTGCTGKRGSVTPTAAAARSPTWTTIGGTRRRVHAREGFKFDWPAQSPAFFSRETGGNGILIDAGMHLLDLLLRWFGEPESLDYRNDAARGGGQLPRPSELTGGNRGLPAAEPRHQPPPPRPDRGGADQLGLVRAPPGSPAYTDGGMAASLAGHARSRRPVQPAPALARGRLHRADPERHLRRGLAWLAFAGHPVQLPPLSPTAPDPIAR
jgi:hypothetical protein